MGPATSRSIAVSSPDERRSLPFAHFDVMVHRKLSRGHRHVWLETEVAWTIRAFCARDCDLKSVSPQNLEIVLDRLARPAVPTRRRVEPAVQAVAASSRRAAGYPKASQMLKGHWAAIRTGPVKPVQA